MQVAGVSVRGGSAAVFMWSPGARQRQVRQVSPRGVTRVHIYPSEPAMLLAWLQWLREADPDILNVFQVNIRLFAAITHRQNISRTTVAAMGLWSWCRGGCCEGLYGPSLLASMCDHGVMCRCGTRWEPWQSVLQR